MMKKIILILNEQEKFMFVKTEDNLSVYVASNNILGGKNELYKLIAANAAFAEVAKNNKGFYAIVVGSQKALNRRGYGNPADVAAAKAAIAERAAEEAARKAQEEAARKAHEEALKAAEKEAENKKELLLSKVSETNKVFETIVIDDPTTPSYGKQTKDNYVFDKESIIKIIKEFLDDLSWDEESQEFQIKQIWKDTQDWMLMPSIKDVATPIK